MPRTVIALHSSDVDATLQLQAEDASTEVWLFDPSLYGRFKARSVRNLRLLTHADCLDIHDCMADTHERVCQIQSKLKALFDLHLPGAEAELWQYTNLFQQLTYLYTYARHWDKLLQTHALGQAVVLIHNTSGFFSTPSYWPALLLIERLQRQGIAFSAYSYGQGDYAIQLPAELTVDVQLPLPNAIVHLPTCFYDGPMLGAEIARVFPQSINLQTGIWDVDLPGVRNAQRVPAESILSLLPEMQQNMIEVLVEKIRQLFVDEFSAFTVSQEHVLRQAKQLASLYRAQLVLFLRLMVQREGAPPEKIILSNHCAGIHGPLLSFGRLKGIAILMLPHSKFFNWPVATRGEGLTACTHPLQGIDIRDVDGMDVDSVYLSFAENHECQQRDYAKPWVVGIVLNEVGGRDSLYIPTERYLQGLRQLTGWLEENGLPYSIRARPGCTCVEWICEQTGIDPRCFQMAPGSTIAEYAKGCDLCLMYDIPTSGAIDLLKSAVPVVSVITRALHSIEAGIASTEVIPRETVEKSIARLAHYLAQPQALQEFRRIQFANYMRLYAKAQPLSVLLQRSPVTA
jgi:hypothetical protein